MVKTRYEKKRKVSSDGNAAVSVKAEESDDDAAEPVPAPPPVPSNLSPIQKILRVDLWKDDSEMVESALTQLADLCSKGNEESVEKSCAALHQLGGAGILPVVMRKWYGFPVIQAEGCRALQNASCSKIANAFTKSVNDSGGLDAIIWAMKSYPDNLRCSDQWVRSAHECGLRSQGKCGIRCQHIEWD